MADEEQWSMCEDGCLNVNTDPKAIIYHPNLNVILLVSNALEVFVIDVNTGAILHKSSYSGETRFDISWNSQIFNFTPHPLNSLAGERPGNHGFFSSYF